MQPRRFDFTSKKMFHKQPLWGLKRIPGVLQLSKMESFVTFQESWMCTWEMLMKIAPVKNSVYSKQYVYNKDFLKRIAGQHLLIY